MVHIGGALGEQVPRGLAVGLGEVVEKRCLALQRADDRAAKFLLKPARHAGEQRVRETDHVRRRQRAQPLDKTVEFTGLPAVFAAQHR